MNDFDLKSATSWTGIMFLRAAAEFSRRTNRSDWNEAALSTIPSRLVRYRRLAALAKGFNVEPDFTALFDGRFLAHRSAETLQVVKDTILRDVEENEPQLLSTIRPDQWDGWPGTGALIIYTEFSRLLIKAYALGDSGVHLANGLYLYPILKAERVRKLLSESLESIERVVDLFIAPDGRSRELSELSTLGWPADDLNLIDSESF